MLALPASRDRLSDQLRTAIDDTDRHGMTRYRICQEIGLTESTMSRFMNGQCGLSLRTIDAIAELLELKLTTREKRRRKR